MIQEIVNDVLSIISRNYGPEMRLVYCDDKQYIVGQSSPAYGLDLLDNCATLYVAQYFASDLKNIISCLDRFPLLTFEQEIGGDTQVLSPFTVFSREERQGIVQALQDLKPFFQKLEGTCRILSRYIEVYVENDNDGTAMYTEYHTRYSSWEDLVDQLQNRLTIGRWKFAKNTCLDTQRTLDILHTIPQVHRKDLILFRY